MSADEHELQELLLKGCLGGLGRLRIGPIHELATARSARLADQTFRCAQSTESRAPWAFPTALDRLQSAGSEAVAALGS